MTKVFHVTLVLATGLLALGACQQGEQPGTAAQSRTTPALTKVDVVFINRVSVAGPQEVAFAQLAATKSADPAVRHFAEDVIGDFTRIDQRLGTIAQGNGMTPASDMDGRHQMLYRQLQSTNGAAFDRGYIDGQLQDLTMLIEAFQAEADSGSEPQVRSLATQSLPPLQQHLQAAAKIKSL
jgi:putative membrane protein